MSNGNGKTVAVLGAGGTMGMGIAESLLRAGFQVRGWNRHPEAMRPLAEHGAQVFDAAAEAVREADFVLTMLADAEAVSATAEEAFAGLGKDSSQRPIWVQASTIGEQGTEHCMELAQRHELRFADAPVLGTKKPAEEGKLVVIASGPQELREPLGPLFDAIGQRTMWVGEAGAGSRLKLAINLWIGTVVEGGAEVLAFAEGLGLDPQLILEALGGGPLDLPYLQMKGKAMIERSFDDPSFKLSLAAKDMRLAQEAAERRDIELPLLETVRRRFDEGSERHGDQDFSATYLTTAEAIWKS